MQPVSPQPLLSEEDYGAIEAAVMETARGRWFLAEYGRRNRNADTAAVLAAIRRLERMVESIAATDARDEVARGMANIAQAIAAVELTATAASVQAPGRSDPSPALAGTVEDASSPALAGMREDEAVGTAEPAALVISDEQPATGAEGARAEAAAEAPEAQPVEEESAGLVTGEEETAVATANEDGPFPIQELDEAAAEELLTRDSQRQELKLPSNRLAASRRSRLDMASLLAVPREVSADLPMLSSAPPPVQPGLVTFVDEEPVESSDSVFSAPLRLEPEEPSAKEAEAQTIVMSSSWSSRLPTGPRMTIAEIEAMTFKRKAALFS